MLIANYSEAPGIYLLIHRTGKYDLPGLVEVSSSIIGVFKTITETIS